MAKNPCFFYNTVILFIRYAKAMNGLSSVVYSRTERVEW